MATWNNMQSRSLLLCLCYLAFTYSMAAEAAKTFTKAQTTGVYAYSFQGELVFGPFADAFGPGPIKAAGVIDIHWGTKLSVDAHGERTYSANGLTFSNDFECTLTLAPDGTGDALCVVVPTPAGDLPAETFRFVFEDNGKSFRYIGTTEGITVLGNAKRQ